MIDILGYNDRVIARRLPIHPVDEDNYDTFIPGHDKYDEIRLLEEQRPDGFFQIWGIKRGMGPVAKVLPSYGYRKVGRFWMRSDSPYVDTQGAPPPAAEEPQEPAAGGGDDNGAGAAGDAGAADTPGAQAQLPPRARHPHHAQTSSRAPS